LDKADGLTNVLKLPNTVVDLQEVELKHQQSFDFLQSDAKNVAEMDEWLSTELYNYLFLHLPSVVRQSPPYRIRPVFLDACNLLETDYPQINEGSDLSTTLVGKHLNRLRSVTFKIFAGVSLPAQLATIMKSRFSKRNAFPLDLLAIGASYKQVNSAVEQQTTASLLRINDQESTSIPTFHSVADTIGSFLQNLRVDFTVDRTKPEQLAPFASANLAFNTKSGQIATISFVGTYISERLNIRLDDTDKEPKFARLCHAHINLSRVGELLLNK
jgi:hypothetical protein